MAVMKAAAVTPSQLERVIVDGDGSDNDYSCVGNDNPNDVELHHAETKHDVAEAGQDLVQGDHDGARTNDFDKVRGLNAYYMVKDAESDDTGSGGTSEIHFSHNTGTEAAHLPKKALAS